MGYLIWVNYYKKNIEYLKGWFYHYLMVWMVKDLNIHLGEWKDFYSYAMMIKT